MSESEKRRCCVRGCSSNESNVRETMFLFPPNNDLRGRRWVEMFPHCLERQPYTENNYICARHFTPDCFNKSGALLHRADPSVNIDTSYAQDIIMRLFIMKAIYEWVLRNSVETYTLSVWDRLLEAKVLLGIQIYTKKGVWTNKFVKFKLYNDAKGIRFGSGQKGPKGLLEIIKDIRKELPSNYKIPADKMKSFESIEEESSVKNNSEDETEEPADEPVQYRDVVPMKSLDTYQEALEMLTPLKDYIKRIGDKNASLRLSEIETVVQQAIKDELKPRRASKRRR